MLRNIQSYIAYIKPLLAKLLTHGKHYTIQIIQSIRQNIIIKKQKDTISLTSKFKQYQKTFTLKIHTLQKIGYITGGILAVFSLLIITGFIILNVIDTNNYKKLIEEKVAQATGRTLKIEGDLKPIFSLRPSIQVENVSFANAPWSKDPYMLQTKKFKIELALLPLIFGKLNITELKLSDTIILLEKNHKGQANWQLTTAKKEEEKSTRTLLPELEHISLNNVTLIYKDQTKQKSHKVKITKLLLEQTGLIFDKLKLFAKGNYNNTPIFIKGKISRLPAFIDGNFTIDLDARLPQTELSLQGKFSDFYQDQDIDLTLTAKGKNLNLLSTLPGIPALPAKPFNIHLEIEGDNEEYEIEDTYITIGKTTIIPNLSIENTKERPFIKGTITSKKLNIKDLTPPPGKTPAAKIFPTTPLPIDTLRSIDAKIKLTIGTINANGLKLTDNITALTLKNGVVKFATNDTNLAKGTLSASSTFSTQQTPPSLSLHIKGQKILLEKILSDMAVTKHFSDGPINFNIETKSKGHSIQQIMANMHGEASLYMDKGRFNKKVSLGTADEFFGLLQGKDKKTAIDIHCTVSNFDIKQGIAKTTAMVMDSSYATISGKGTIDLGQEKFNLVITPKSKAIGLTDLILPMKLGGTFTKPKFYPNPEAIAKTVGTTALGIVTGIGIFAVIIPKIAEKLNIDEKDNPCFIALNKQAEQGSLTERSIKKTTDTFKSLEEKIQKLLPFGKK